VRLIVLFPFLALVLCSALAALGALLVWKWLPAWRDNGYGICTGKHGPDFPSDTAGPAPFEGLTPWIHRVIQTAAGRSVDDPPLTFGELWTAPPPVGTPPPAQGLSAPRSIELTMIASDISRNRSAQLPFLESPSELYIEEAMLRRYLPPAVVKWMCNPCRHGKYGDRVEKRDGVFRLPLPENLPLVLAARLSLSFPVLLSAVPLLTPDYAGKRTNRQIKLRRVWYSDGGLTSNFPIHFFDSPIPSRPTFCLNLVDFDGELTTAQAPPEEAIHQAKEPERQEAANDATREAGKAIARHSAPERKAAARPAAVSEADPRPGDDVWDLVSMASRNAMSPAPFTRFDEAPGLGLIPFIATLINTARLWADNQMLIAPGTRDRVVHIGLRDDEGGLNLDMPANTIADLNRRGRAAGMLIAARFDLQGTIDPETGKPISPAFPNHRWVRYRNFMAAFEKLLRRFADSRHKSDAAADTRGESRIHAMIEGPVPEKVGYPPTNSARPYFKESTDALEKLAEAIMGQSQTFDPQSGGVAPRPKMRASLRPLAGNDPLA
jgi:hypothetical protein